MIFSKVKIVVEKKDTGFKEEYYIVVKREVKSYFRPSSYARSNNPFDIELYKKCWDNRIEKVDVRRITNAVVSKYLANMMNGKIREILPNEELLSIIDIFGACNATDYLDMKKHAFSKRNARQLEDNIVVTEDFYEYSVARINGDFNDFYVGNNKEKSIRNLQKALEQKDKQAILDKMLYFSDINFKVSKNKGRITKIDNVKLPYELVIRNIDDITVQNVKDEYGFCKVIMGEYTEKGVFRKEKNSFLDYNKQAVLKDTFNMNGILDSKLVIYKKSEYTNPIIRMLKHKVEIGNTVVGILAV